MEIQTSGAISRPGDTIQVPRNKQFDELPGPPGIPLLGNILQIKLKALHRIIEKWSDRYGTLYKIQLGAVPVLVVTGAETIQTVLKNRPDDFRRLAKMDEVIRELGATGVFNAEGDEWKQQRKIFSRALNAGNVKQFFPTLVSITEKLLNRWNNLSVSGSDIEIRGDLMRYTVDITSRLAFGYNMNTIEKKEDIIQDHLEIIFPALFKRINSPVPYWRFFKLAADRKLERSLDTIEDTLQKIIDKTREQMVHSPDKSDHSGNFLEALIKESDAEHPLTNEELIGNVLAMLLGGEDTTAHTIAWMFYFMHFNSDVQHKMQQEADLVLADDPVLKNFDNLGRLRYIEAVAFEAMRLKPVAPLLFLETLKDVVVEGVEVPKGIPVMVHTQYAASRESHFSNAGKFIPERWMDGGCPAHQAHDEKAFIPFGAGPRYCPGHNLAMLEIKAAVAMVCKNFNVEITSPEPVTEILAFTMMPSRFMIRLTKRT